MLHRLDEDLDVRHAVARQMLHEPPATPAQLHRFIERVLGMRIAWRARIAGHDSPFHYLCHAFFEHERQQRHAVVWAARGTGKTIMGALATVLDLIFKPGIRIAVLGGSFTQSFRMHAHVCRFFREQPLRDLIAGEVSRTGLSLRNGSRVEIVSQSHRSVRGLRVHRLRCDEVELFTRELWEAAQMITRSDRCGRFDVNAGVEALSIMHVPGGLMSELIRDAPRMRARLFTWNVIDVLETCPPQRDCAQCQLHDPIQGGCGGIAKDLPRSRLPSHGFFRIDDALDQWSRTPPRVWRSEMLCREVDLSRSVYHDFDPRVHAFGDADASHLHGRGAMWLGGIDFGYRAPTVILIAALDGVNVLHVTDEIVEQGWTTDRLINRTRDVLKLRGVGTLEFFGVDPAGLQRNEQTGISSVTRWRQAGFTVRTRTLGISPGILAVQTRLRSGDQIGLRIHRRCTQLINAMQRYRYSADRSKEVPLKEGHDHACDALRYMIVNLDAHQGRTTTRSYLDPNG